MRHADIEVDSIGSFVDGLLSNHNQNGLTWYRGHASLTKWRLVPSIARNPDHLNAELTTIKIFKQQARPLLQTVPATDWEWIFLMQHHRAPTRLLDWSENPLAALHFALDDPKDQHAGEDAVVWVLDPVSLNRHAGHKHEFEKDILAFDIDKSLDAYLPQNINPKITKLAPIAGIGPQNSRRMAAQSGTFTVIHSEITPIDEVDGGQNVWRLIIPAARKAEIRRQLLVLRVGDFTFFPDLESVAGNVRELLT